MSRRRDKVCIGNRIRMKPRSDEAGNMRDIDQQIGTDRFGDLLKTRKIQHAGIGTGSDYDHPWPAFLRDLLNGIVVDGFGLAIDAIGEDTEEKGLPRAARSILEFAGPQRIFCFYGDLGAGKTTLIKEMC